MLVCQILGTERASSVEVMSSVRKTCHRRLHQALPNTPSFHSSMSNELQWLQGLASNRFGRGVFCSNTQMVGCPSGNVVTLMTPSLVASYESQAAEPPVRAGKGKQSVKAAVIASPRPPAITEGSGQGVDSFRGRFQLESPQKCAFLTHRKALAVAVTFVKKAHETACPWLRVGVRPRERFPCNQADADIHDLVLQQMSLSSVPMAGRAIIICQQQDF